MFCNNCGKPIEDGSSFCNECGAKIELENEQKIPDSSEISNDVEILSEQEDLNSQETIAEESDNNALFCTNCGAQIPEGTAFCTSCGTNLDSSEPQKKPNFFKRIFKKKAIMIPAAVAVLVASFFLTPLGAYAKNAFMKMILSPEKYFQYVISSNAEDYIDTFSKNMEESKNDYKKGVSAEGKAEFIIEDDFYDVIDDLADEDVSEYIDWLKNVSLSYKANSKGLKSDVNMKVDVNNSNIGEFNMVADLEDPGFYFNLGEYNSEYIYVSAEDEYSYNPFIGVNENLDKIMKVLPDSKQSKKLAMKYVEVLVKSVEEVEETKATIEADGISQKVTQLSVEIDGELIKNTSVNFLTEVKKDKELKKIIEDLAEIADVDTDDLWDGLDYLIEEAEDLDEDDLDIGAELHLFVNGKGEISGFEFEVDNFEFANYNTVKGNKFGSSLELSAGGSKFKIEGNGKISGKKRTGTFVMKAAGMSLMEFEIEKVNTKLLKEGVFNGSITIKVHEDAADLLSSYGGVPSSVASTIADTSITIKSKSKSLKDTDCELSINYEDKPCARLIVTEKYKNAGDVKVPSKSVNVEDMEDFEDWVSDIKLSSFADKLEKAKFPDEVVDAVEDAEDSLVDMMFGYGYDDYYYDDYYYDDYYYDDYYYDDYYYDDYYYDDDYDYDDYYDYDY